jgi:hypothetical protein
MILDKASVWAVRTGNILRVVSANDHIHSKNSAHYEDRALDFQGTDLNGLASYFSSMRGYVVYWNVPGHWAHVHVEAR